MVDMIVYVCKEGSYGSFEMIDNYFIVDDVLRFHVDCPNSDRLLGAGLQDHFRVGVGKAQEDAH